MQKARKKSNSNSKSALIIIILLMMIGGGLSGLYFWEKNQRQQEAALVQDDPLEVGPVTVFYKDTLYQRREDLDYYLFMGLDKTTDMLTKPAYQYNYQQADFLLLMVVDHQNQTWYGVHINRDTIAEVQRLGVLGETIESNWEQICLAHAYGSGGKESCRNQVWSVSRYFYDLPIKHYIAVTLDAISVMNDAVGGVVVHISDDFSKADPSLVMGEDVRLSGDQAELYVRGRKSVADGTNVNRMSRQREFINGLYEQINTRLSKDDKFLLRLADKLSDYVISDLTTDQLASLSDSMKNYQFTTIYTIAGETVFNEKTSYIEFITDEDAFLELNVNLFYERA